MDDYVDNKSLCWLHSENALFMTSLAERFKAITTFLSTLQHFLFIIQYFFKKDLVMNKNVLCKFILFHLQFANFESHLLHTTDRNSVATWK